VFAIKHCPTADSSVGSLVAMAPSAVVKQPIARAASASEHTRACRIALLQSQLAAHAVSDVLHAAWRAAHVELPESNVSELVLIGTHAAAASVPLSSTVPGASAAGVSASATGVVAGVLDELQPTCTTPAPTIEAAANPIKYREARITESLREGGTIRCDSVVTQ